MTLTVRSYLAIQEKYFPAEHTRVVRKLLHMVAHQKKVFCITGNRNGDDFVVCGHMHKPSKRRIQRDGGQVLYLNSGDWVENCTALEYNRGG